jgi:predicted ribosomally synthesized peptide with nif11-like leader
MSQENVKLFLEELAKNEALRKEVGPISSTEELAAAAAGAGFPFSTEQYEAYKAVESKAEPVALPDEELDKVAAGGVYVNGYLQTFCWYGCNQFSKRINGLDNGRCNNCNHWDCSIGTWSDWGICLINKQ